MPFTFKLSKRLALMKASLLFAGAAGLALVLACEMAPHPTGPTSAVVQIVVRPESIALDPLQSQQFRAFGRTAAGDSVPATVTWSTSGGTITQSGMYTADTSSSDAIVTATLSASQPAALSSGPTASLSSSGPVSGTASVKKKRLVQILVSPASVTLAEGGGQQFTAYGRKNTGDSVSVSVTYTATGGTVTSGGFYTAGKTVGSFHVTAKQNGGSLADSSAVAVTLAPVAAVSVSPASASVPVGQTAQLTATPRDAAGNPLSGRVVTWASSNTAAGTVNGSGLVSGVAAGTATITATSEGQSGSAAVTVAAAPPPVASVSVSPASGRVVVGQTVQLAATPKDASGNALSGWVVALASSTRAVATVSGSGLVSGVAAGPVTITATSEGQTGSAAVTVTIVPVASVTVSPAAASVPVGQTVQLTATPKDAGGNPLSGRVVTWATSNAAVATVSGSGLVSGVAAGAATI